MQLTLSGKANSLKIIKSGNHLWMQTFQMKMKEKKLQKIFIIYKHSIINIIILICIYWIVSLPFRSTACIAGSDLYHTANNDILLITENGVVKQMPQMFFLGNSFC